MGMKKSRIIVGAFCLALGLAVLPSCCCSYFNKTESCKCSKGEICKCKKDASVCKKCCCRTAYTWFGNTWAKAKSLFVKEEKKVKDVVKDVKKEIITYIENEEIIKDKKSFKKFVKKLDRKNVVVKFSATWCPACHAMTDLDKELATQFVKDVEFIELNVDNAKKLSEEYKVKGIPHYLFLHKGKKVKHTVGGMKKEKYEKTIKKAFKV